MQVLSDTCGTHMQHAAQICFFAHSPEEVRHPTTKPFVPPEALAAATTTATLEAVRKAAADSDANKKEVCATHLMPCCCRHASRMSHHALRLFCGLAPLRTPWKCQISAIQGPEGQCMGLRCCRLQAPAWWMRF